LTQRVEEFALLTTALSERLAALAAGAIASRSERLLALSHALQRGATAKVHARLEHAAQLATRLTLNAHQALAASEARLAKLERALVQRDPQPWLQQGWTQLCDERGPLRSITAVQAGHAL